MNPSNVKKVYILGKFYGVVRYLVKNPGTIVEHVNARELQKLVLSGELKEIVLVGGYSSIITKSVVNFLTKNDVRIIDTVRHRSAPKKNWTR